MIKSHKQLLDEFLLFESQNNLFDLKISSVPIWDLIRVEVFGFLSDQLVVKTINRNKKKISKINFFFDILKFFFLKNPFFSIKEKNIIVLNHPRRKLINNVYVDIYTDRILKELDNNYIVLEGLLNHNISHLNPVESPNNLYYLDIIQLTSRTISNIFKYNLSKDELIHVVNIQNRINENWNVQMFSLTERIKIVISKWRVSSYLVSKLINKLKPKLIINVVSYSFLNQVFCFVAKKRSIKVVELQHGTVGRYHINYNFHKPKSLLLETFPDYFIAWGKYWIKNARLPLNNNNIIIAGFPYIEENFNKINAANNSVDSKKILFISQLRSDIASFANNVALLLPDHKIYFKAHPVEYLIAEDEYKEVLKSGNITVITNDNNNLYEEFKNSAIVCGVYSTTMIEAIPFCNKIAILKLPGWEHFDDIRESDNFKFIDSPENLAAYLNNECSFKTYNSANNFFSSKSVEKITSTINSLLK